MKGRSAPIQTEWLRVYLADALSSRAGNTPSPHIQQPPLQHGAMETGHPAPITSGVFTVSTVGDPVQSVG